MNLIDRYLLGSPVERSNLQLVGVSALLLARRTRRSMPELKDLVYITDKAYTQEQILGMEEKMVKALKYRMTIASVRAMMAAASSSEMPRSTAGAKCSHPPTRSSAAS